MTGRISVFRNSCIVKRKKVYWIMLKIWSKHTYTIYPVKNDIKFWSLYGTFHVNKKVIPIIQKNVVIWPSKFPKKNITRKINRKIDIFRLRDILSTWTLTLAKYMPIELYRTKIEYLIISCIDNSSLSEYGFDFKSVLFVGKNLRIRKQFDKWIKKYSLP